jgi:hypothetical protein
VTAATNFVPGVAEISPGEIRAHCEMIHILAAPLAGQGKLIIAAFGEDPDQVNPKTGKPGLPLTPIVIHAAIGDVGTTARSIGNITISPHRNLYMPLAVLRPDLPKGTKGFEKDIVAVLGLVADFDDVDAPRWAERLPLAPNYVLETSTGRFQAFFFFDKPELFEAVKPIAARLKAFAGCDHGTADLSHVWRVAGSMNWPNARKVAAGRPRESQFVRVAKQWRGERVSLADLAAELPDIQTDRHDQAGAAESEGSDDPSLDEIIARLPPKLRAKIMEPFDGDRSARLFGVIKSLANLGFTRATIIRIIEAHPEGTGAKHAGRRDLLEKDVDRISAKPLSKRSARGPAPCSERGLPIVFLIGGNLSHAVDQAEIFLLSSDSELFQRGDFVVRPAQTPIPIADNRLTLGLRLVPVKINHMIERFTYSVDFKKFDKRSGDWFSINCPPNIAATYLERIGSWRLPVLTGITNAPTLRPDGSVLEQPGYDPQTGILYNPLGVTFAPVPAQPTRDDALAALSEIKLLINEFPFVDEASRSVAISGIQTSIIRRSIPRAPMHAYSAPIMGCGKSKLVDIASIIATGHEAPVIAQGKTEEEMEKRLGAALIAGDTIISFDNCEHPLGGELLCQAMTQSIMNIRILGKSVNVAVPNNAAFFATGNNLVVIGDMTRRTLMSSLDPKCERPELRSFDTDPIDTIRRDRPRYVLAALTVLRAFHVAGRPQQTVPLGSFEDWSLFVRDALVWLGEADPCATMERARAEDPKLEALTNVVEQWYAVLKDKIVSVKDVIDKATGLDLVLNRLDFNRREYLHPDFREALLIVAGEGGAINSRRLGKWLAANKNRVVGGKRIEPETMLNGISRWRISCLT